MARINFDDDVESKDEFWKLLPFVGGDRDLALGKLVRFFRIAQSKFGRGKPIEESELEQAGLRSMIDSGWAVKCGDGYQAKGAEDYFAWYRQKVEAGKKGGKPARDPANRDEPDANRSVPAVNPPAPVLAPANKEEDIYIGAHAREEVGGQIPQQEIETCVKAWQQTLDHFKISRPVQPHENMVIAQLVKSYGYKSAAYALAGARFEQKTDTFDPGKNVAIRRLLDPKLFDKFLNLAAQKKGQGGAA